MSRPRTLNAVTCDTRDTRDTAGTSIPKPRAGRGLVCGGGVSLRLCHQRKQRFELFCDLLKLVLQRP